MSFLSQFTGGQRQVASIINGSSGGTSPAVKLDGGGGSTTVGVASLSSGPLTSNVLSTVLSVSGSGALNVCVVKTINATSRAIRLRITIDGRVLFNNTTPSFEATGWGLIGVGALTGATVDNGPVFQPIQFNTSCLVEVASSLTETDSIVTLVNYEVYV